MDIKYLRLLNELIEIFKDRTHNKHNRMVYEYKKDYGYKNCKEIIVQLENRRNCLIDLLENFSQKDFEMLFCFRNLNKNIRQVLYKHIMKNFSSEFALLDYALTNRFNTSSYSWKI